MKKNIQKEDELKKKSFSRFIKSFKFCFDGMKYAFYHEVNLLVMIAMAIIATILGIVLHVSYEETLILVVLIGLILSLEMINCSIEAVVDIATKEKCELAKVAKDCASGAVGIMSVIAFIIGLMIFLPKIIELF